MLLSGFYAMIRYIYSGKEKTIIGITDLEQLFQVYILADKVSLYGTYVWLLTKVAAGFVNLSRVIDQITLKTPTLNIVFNSV